MRNDFERPQPEINPDESVHLKRNNELAEQVNSVRQIILAFESFLKYPDSKQAHGYRKDDIEFLKDYAKDQLDRLFRQLGLMEIYLLRGEANKQVAEHPELFDLYADILGRIIRREHAESKKKLEASVEGKSIDSEIKSELDNRTISLGRELSGEQAQALRVGFPSGNYLLHSSGLNGFIKIVNSGEILTASALTKGPIAAGGGGLEGISFNINNVRVLIGDKKHFVGFIASPEIVLKDGLKLTVPYEAAPHEVQLVAKEYRNRYQSDAERDLGYLDKDAQLKYPPEKLPRIKIEDTYVFCSETDEDAIKQLLAAEGRLVKGVLTYPTEELRVASWSEGKGDHKAASKLLGETFAQAGLKPSIDYEEDLLGGPMELEQGVFVGSWQVDKAKVIVNTPKGLELVKE